MDGSLRSDSFTSPSASHSYRTDAILLDLLDIRLCPKICLGEGIYKCLGFFWKVMT